LVSAFTALIFFILLKLFLWDFVKVNSRDMRGTYDYNDLLLIKKVIFAFEQNDVLYVEYPVKDSADPRKTFLFTRLIGLPGDTALIADKLVYINGQQLKEDSTIQKNYFIETNHKALTDLFKKTYQLSEGGEISNEFDYSYSLTRHQSEFLKKDTTIKKIALKSEKQNNFDETCFPYSLHYPWNLDYYGKLYIPKKNDTLRLDTVSVKLYSDLIRGEKNTVEIRKDSIFISGIHSTIYVPKQNYFFVLGDNRDNANDSRSWGFLPEKYIVGKVVGRLTKARK